MALEIVGSPQETPVFPAYTTIEERSSQNSNASMEAPIFPEALNLSLDVGLKVGVIRQSPVAPTKTKKKVTFSKEAKTWDGLRAINTDFDELLYCFLVKGQSIGDGDILKWTSEDSLKIFRLCKLLNNLIARLRSQCQEIDDKSSKDKREKQVPCLPEGGGRAMRVEKAYEPYLVSLLSVLATALNISRKSNCKNLNQIVQEDEVKLMDHFVQNKSNLSTLVVTE